MLNLTYLDETARTVPIGTINAALVAHDDFIGGDLEHITFHEVMANESTLILTLERAGNAVKVGTQVGSTSEPWSPTIGDAPTLKQRLRF